MTASNHTYRRLLGWSSQPGIGIPQEMSRLMARGRTSSSRCLEKAMTLGRHSPVASTPSSHSPRVPASAGMSRK